MKILLIIPPYIPSYFNAGHHLPVFQVAEYLRHNLDAQSQVVAIDAAALNYSWNDICQVLMQDFDIILVLNDFDAIDGFERFITYVKRLCTAARLGTFGRLSKQIPEFFFRFGFDWVASGGDYEAAALEMVLAANGSNDDPMPGVWTRVDGHYLEPSKNVFLDAEQWVFPNIEEIPYGAYDRLYANDMNKFCGIPQRRELVVPIARGCPVGCSYCDVPSMQGRKERRVSVAAVLNYIEHAYQTHPFEYFSFYAPTFTLDKRWVYHFCEQIHSLDDQYHWKCVTTPVHLDPDIIVAMGAAGCIRISIGIETLDKDAIDVLPKSKRTSVDKLRSLSKLCRDAGIELNCFVVLGLPGDTYAGVDHTVEQVLNNGARIRPAIYTPYHLLRSDMTTAEVSAFNRQLFVESARPAKDEQEYYRLFFSNPNDTKTQVMGNIPIKN